MKILFTCGIMSVGGVQKSLVNLLKSIDYDKYQVDLMLPNKEGNLISEVPKSVNIIIAPKIVISPAFTRKDLIKDILTLMKYPSFIKPYFKVVFDKKMKSPKHRQQIFWKEVYSSSDKSYDYDIAISYAGGIGVWNNFIIDKVRAKNKISWLHGNYQIFGTKSQVEKDYLRKFDKIVTVSEFSKEILIEEIPDLRNKTYVIPNIISKEKIIKMANEKDVYKNKYEGTRILSIARLDKDKGLDMGIKAISELIKRGFKIKWDIIGEGNERKDLELMIKEFNCEKNIRLLGFKENPYPYLNKTDIFLHPSKSEGFGLVIAEAKVLAKPILVTNFRGVDEQIINNYNGLIVSMNVKAIEEGLINLINGKKLREKYQNNLINFSPNRDTIYRFYKLINP